MVRLTKGAGKRLFIVLGQGQVAPELLQMRGHDCPSDGLWRSPDNDSTIAAVRPPVTARNTSSLVV